jgi:hypothetical protein
MPKINFNNYDDNKVGQFSTVQPGKYLCRIFEITVASTSKGAEMWKLDLIIEEDGTFYGKHLFDNIVFSSNEFAMNRAKHIFKAFGVDTSQERDYTIDDLQDKYAEVRVDRIYPYINKDNQKREKSVIAFDGYKSVKGAETTEDDIPF